MLIDQIKQLSGKAAPRFAESLCADFPAAASLTRKGSKEGVETGLHAGAHAREHHRRHARQGQGSIAGKSGRV